MNFELKPFQRVKLRNGREGIVVANPLTDQRYSEFPLILVFTDNASGGFMPALMEERDGETGWNVKQVWNHNTLHCDLLSFHRKGESLWKEESDLVTKAKADVVSAKALLASAEARLQDAVEDDE